MPPKSPDCLVGYRRPCPGVRQSTERRSGRDPVRYLGQRLILCAGSTLPPGDHSEGRGANVLNAAERIAPKTWKKRDIRVSFTSFMHRQCEMLWRTDRRFHNKFGIHSSNVSLTLCINTSAFCLPSLFVLLSVLSSLRRP